MFSREVPTNQLCRVSFGTYSTDEILALSVKEITNPQTFDDLGHARENGLHDLHLGPVDRWDVCATCSLNQVFCPGHMGHITLSVPVFNPVFFNVMYQEHHCHLLVSQLQLLEHGRISDVSTLESLMASAVSEYAGSPNCSELIKRALDEEVDKILSSKKWDLEESSIKNIIGVRHNLIQNFIRTYMNKSTKKCSHCGTPRRTMRTEYNSRVMFTRGLSNKQAINIVQQRKNKTLKSSPEGDNNAEDRHEDGAEDDATEKDICSLMGQTFLTPLDARAQLQAVWKKDSKILRKLYPVFESHAASHPNPTDIFFLDVVPVPPNKFRPLSFLNDSKFENSQTSNLNKILTDSIVIREILCVIRDQEKEPDKEIEPSAQYKSVVGQTPTQKLQNAWILLQTHVNGFIDCELDKLSKERHAGIRQVLEKKEGLFRKHMMGKRVNYAARTVISPDPCIGVEEIGIPDIFAKKLTFPTPVTPWNVEMLRKLVINGPNKHPGASLIVNENGSKILLDKMKKAERVSIAKRLMTPENTLHKLMAVKQVYRHLHNGDVLLVNRQPTLHRPSIMAHKARVLPGEKTLRLHYANCKSYNADFDGDEMNVHFPQSEVARSEAYNIAINYKQYLGPKDGTPLGGLIQDHMVSGVSMTVRGRFFTKEEYQNLVYSALPRHQYRFRLLLPSIVKPVKLWSGKQLVSTVLLNLVPSGKVPLTLEGATKISSKHWQREPARNWKCGKPLPEENCMCESTVIIRHGELLVGVLDKNAYGATPYSLVHCCYELYGGETACQLLTAFTRLFTAFLTRRGFTLGIEDILVKPQADKIRKQIMLDARDSGIEEAATALGVQDSSDKAELLKKLKLAHRDKDEGDMKELDLRVKARTDEVNNEINKACFPRGLLKIFPENNLQLMVQSGAKGSTVNCMQISCLLGQIELEGRRPPLMISGASLPSFVPYATFPRAGGFIDGRFLTGIRPQEFFFHCMAGRDGLVDTAVKTSRSGYLQRCIIKHLEGITVAYDMTVRDSDGSVIQYGEDSLDISKVQLLNKKQLNFLVDNYDAVVDNAHLQKVSEKFNLHSAMKLQKKVDKWKRKHANTSLVNRTSPFLFYTSKNLPHFQEKCGNVELNKAATRELIKNWYNVLDKQQKKKYYKHVAKCPDPVISQVPANLYFGAVSERLSALMDEYIASNLGHKLADVPCHGKGVITTSEFKNMMFYKSLRAMADPGEAVGLLAAQSIGEPSTQMTLNTFHFAGRGEMNVTLGIPRLREILMTASRTIRTPTMDIPFKPGVTEKQMHGLTLKLNKVFVSSFLPHKFYKSMCLLQPTDILRFVERHYIDHIIKIIRKNINSTKQARQLNSRVEKTKRFASRTNEDGEESGGRNADEGDSDVDENDEGAAAEQLRDRFADEGEYRGEEDERKELQVDDKDEDEEVLGGGDANNDEYDDDDDDVIERTESEELMLEVAEQQGENFQSHSKKQKRKKPVEVKMDQSRVEAAKGVGEEVHNYAYDAINEEWCRITFKLPLAHKIDLTSILDNDIKKVVIHQTPSITRSLIVDSLNGKKMLKTEGVNILEMFKYDTLLDLNHLYTNDIYACMMVYGIEAAAKLIKLEITNVFKAYGIEVDQRHLSLISDYMTFEGTYSPFNRVGIDSNSSPFQKMSFETTMYFLRKATLHGAPDDLKSPSSRIVTGRLTKGGTGCIDLMQPLI